MSETAGPSREAALETIAQLKEAFAALPPKGAKADAFRRMELDLVSAVMLGIADLQDAGVEQEAEIGASVVEALSGGLGSYVLTAAQGDRDQASRLAKSLIRALKERTLIRTGRGTDVVGVKPKMRN